MLELWSRSYLYRLTLLRPNLTFLSSNFHSVALFKSVEVIILGVFKELFFEALKHLNRYLIRFRPVEDRFPCAEALRQHPAVRYSEFDRFRRSACRGRTRSHAVERGRTRSYEVARGHTRSHGVTGGRTRSYEVRAKTLRIKSRPT